MASAPASAERSLSTCPVPPEASGGGFHSLGAGLRLDYLEPLRSRPGRLQAVFGEQRVVDHLHLMGLDLATPRRAEGALPGRRCGVVDAGDERQAYPQSASLAARQSLEDLSAAVFDLLDLGQADHQWPAQALGEEEGQHPGAFPGFRLAAGEHQLRAGVAQVLGQCGQGVGAGRLFQHGQAFQAHAEIAAQRLGVRVAGVQHL